jgi:hypothetical protein
VTVARFRTAARLELASQITEATVTIDRESGVVSVRPLRRRRAYIMPLSDVAAWIVRTTIRQELGAKLAARNSRRQGRRRRARR